LDLAGQTPSRFLTALNKLDFEPNPFEQSFSQIASPESESTFLNPDASSGSTLTDYAKEASSLESPATTSNTSENTSDIAHLRRSSVPNPNSTTVPKNSSTTAYEANIATTTSSVTITKTSSSPSAIASTVLDNGNHQHQQTTLVLEGSRSSSDKRSPIISRSSPRIVLPPAAAIDSPNPAISNIRSSASGVDFGWDSLTKGPLSPILLSGPKDSPQPLMSKSAMTAIHRSSAFATNNTSNNSNTSNGGGITNGNMKYSSMMMSTSAASSLYMIPTSEFISNSENRMISSPLATVTPMRPQDIVNVKPELPLDSTMNSHVGSNSKATASTTASIINTNDSTAVARFSAPAINPLFAKAVGLHPNTSNTAQLSPRTAALFAAATQEHMAIKREEQVRAAVAAAAVAATASINTTIDPIALSAELAPLPTVIAPNQLTTTTTTNGNNSSLPGAATIATTANLATLPLATTGTAGFDGSTDSISQGAIAADTISLSDITQLQVRAYVYIII
jgi:hypothetical protein